MKNTLNTNSHDFYLCYDPRDQSIYWIKNSDLIIDTLVYTNVQIFIYSANRCTRVKAKSSKDKTIARPHLRSAFVKFGSTPRANRSNPASESLPYKTKSFFKTRTLHQLPWSIRNTKLHTHIYTVEAYSNPVAWTIVERNRPLDIRANRHSNSALRNGFFPVYRIS